jgi:hypothetical protein
LIKSEWKASNICAVLLPYCFSDVPEKLIHTHLFKCLSAIPESLQICGVLGGREMFYFYVSDRKTREILWGEVLFGRERNISRKPRQAHGGLRA